MQHTVIQWCPMPPPIGYEQGGSVFCSANLLFLATDGVVFFGYYHENGYCYGTEVGKPAKKIHYNKKRKEQWRPGEVQSYGLIVEVTSNPNERERVIILESS